MSRALPLVLMLAAGFLVAAAFFLRFWRQTRDPFFIAFALGFAVLAVQRVLLAPQAIASFTAAMDAGNANMLEVSLGLAGNYAWAFYWIVGGLLLMGFGRVIMLLGAINRSLRGQV